MRILFASHTAQVGVFRVGSHHLSRELARAGHDVVHVSSAVSLAHLARIRSSGVRDRFSLALRSPRTDSEGVVHVEPIVPLPIDTLPPKLGDAELRFPLKPWRFALGRSELRTPDVMFIDQPLLAGLIDVLKPRRVVYRPTDAHFEPAMRAAEVRILERADAVVATSSHVLEDVTRHLAVRPPSLVLENGVEYDRFDAGDQTRARSGVVYLGALDKRFDWSALQKMSNAFPDVPFSVAGPLPQTVPVTLPSNVELLGPVPYVEAPALLASALVGILPLSSDPGNQGRSPMKYYEYLASGLRVVASASETLRARTAPGVWLHDDSDRSVDALRAALNEGTTANEAGREFAREYGWKNRADDLIRFVGGITGDSSGRGRRTQDE